MVVPHDYLDPLIRLIQSQTSKTSKMTTETPQIDSHVQTSYSESPTPDLDDSDLKNELLRNAELAASLVYRSSTFGFRHPPRSVASASIFLAIKSRQSREEEKGEESKIQFSDFLSPALRQRLCLTSPEDEKDLKDCLSEMESLLLNDLQKCQSEKEESKDEDSPVKFGTPPKPQSTGSSPFKISSASTPKRSRLPLKDGSNLPVTTFRRRLQQQVKQLNQFI